MNLHKCKLARGPFDKKLKKCDWCAKSLPKRRRRWCSDGCSKQYWNNHNYSTARRITKRRDKYQCIKCGAKKKLEVNHIKPCLGKHSKKGCWHHLENLETLCHDCHLKITAEQRAAGKLK